MSEYYCPCCGGFHEERFSEEGKAESGLSVLLERKAVIDAIDAEPEYPGEPPEDMYIALTRAVKARDMDFIFEAMRITVRLTKQEIRERVNALLQYIIPSTRRIKWQK